MMTDSLRDDMKAGFNRIDNEFLAVRSEFVAVRAEMTAGFKTVDERLKQVDDQIKAEGETTRRYFDIVAEQFKEYVKVLADGTARNTERFDDHEKRLTVPEHPRG